MPSDPALDVAAPAHRPRRTTYHRSLSAYLQLFSKVSVFIVAGLFVVYIVGEIPQARSNFTQYDLMSVTGFLTFFFAIYWSRSMRDRFHDLVEGLTRSKVVDAQDDRGQFDTAVMRSVGKWCCLFMALAMLLVFAVFALANDVGEQPLLCWTSVFAAAVAGERYGRLACYARGTGLIDKSGGRLRIQFWHPDNAGGLLPMSNFYLYTMFLAAIPAFWLASWWVWIPHMPAAFARLHEYERWRVPFGAMWIVVTVIAAISFIRPILTIHRAMEDAKEEFIKQFAWIPPKVTALHALAEQQQDGDVGATLLEIDALQKIYREAVAVNTWPLDKTVIGVFTGLNAAQLLLPLWLKLVVGEQPDWGDALEKLIGKMSGS